MTLKPLTDDTRVAVLGLGYVGLPLAYALSKHFQTVGFDIDRTRVDKINCGHDGNLALTPEELGDTSNIVYSNDPQSMRDCDFFIITAPTPVDSQNQPDLGPVLNAARTAARLLKKGDVVVFESTLYPGATEEECVPVLESESGLTLNRDFFVGYSPERVNPGDDVHTITGIVKVTSGSIEEAAEKIDNLYKRVITAGTHRASSIKVAEAAKVIENTQRDLNIALINELAILFNKLGIDTQEVLQAAGSKWNFLPFRPGLVGGHCIGVDPYYLTYKAQQVGYHPEVILAGRRINDSMGNYVAERLVRLMLGKRIQVFDSRILILGLTFKENCPDTRNTRVADIISTLAEYNAQIQVFDPWANRSASDLLIEEPVAGSYDAIVIAVAHRQFIEMGIDRIKALGKPTSVVFDVKHIFDRRLVDGNL